GDGRQVAARVGAGRGVIRAVAGDRHDIGVEGHVARRVQGEGDGAGGVEAAGEDGGVGQLGAAADDDGAAGHRVDGRAGGLDHLALVLAVVGGAAVVGVAVVPGTPLFRSGDGRQVAARVGAGRGVIRAVAGD